MKSIKMKKIFLLVAFAAVAFSADASMIYTKWCGKQVQTVSPDYFTNDEDREWYYNWLNEDLCGSATDPNVDTEDHDTSTDEQP